MRLIDADRLQQDLINQIDWLRKQDYELYCAIGDDITWCIDKQPTAYDVDKVVERLETDSSVKLYGSGNSDNYLIPIKRAIDIVKDGRINDD